MAGADLGEAFGCMVKIILLLVVFSIFGMGYFFHDVYFKKKTEIVSPHPIIPEKQLIIKDNKVDTLYIYYLKKE